MGSFLPTHLDSKLFLSLLEPVEHGLDNVPRSHFGGIRANLEVRGEPRLDVANSVAGLILAELDSDPLDHCQIPPETYHR